MSQHSMRFTAKLTGISLLLAYGTYGLLAVPAIEQRIKWYIFGLHMLLIVATFVIGIVGAVRGDRVCMLAIIGDAPLIYMQFLS